MQAHICGRELWVEHKNVQNSQPFLCGMLIMTTILVLLIFRHSVDGVNLQSSSLRGLLQCVRPVLISTIAYDLDSIDFYFIIDIFIVSYYKVFNKL